METSTVSGSFRSISNALSPPPHPLKFWRLPRPLSARSGSGNPAQPLQSRASRRRAPRLESRPRLRRRVEPVKARRAVLAGPDPRSAAARRVAGHGRRVPTAESWVPGPGARERAACSARVPAGGACRGRLAPGPARLSGGRSGKATCCAGPGYRGEKHMRCARLLDRRRRAEAADSLRALTPRAYPPAWNPSAVMRLEGDGEIRKQDRNPPACPSPQLERRQERRRMSRGRRRRDLRQK